MNGNVSNLPEFLSYIPQYPNCRDLMNYFKRITWDHQLLCKYKPLFISFAVFNALSALPLVILHSWYEFCVQLATFRRYYLPNIFDTFSSDNRNETNFFGKNLRCNLCGNANKALNLYCSRLLFWKTNMEKKLHWMDLCTGSFSLKENTRKLCHLRRLFILLGLCIAFERISFYFLGHWNI